MSGARDAAPDRKAEAVKPVLTPEQRAARAAALQKKRDRRRIQDRVVMTLLIWLAVVLAVYPVAGTFWNNYKAYQYAQETIHQQDSVPVDTQAAQLKAAREYNARLKPTTMFDPVGKDAATRDPAYQDYLRQLAAGDAMAVVRIPGIKVSLPVRHGTDDDVLSKGAGHVYGTHLPVGGTGTHSALSAHSALAQMTAFDRLKDVKKGELVFVDVMGETLAYEVDDVQVVLPDKMDALKAIEGKDLLTLITCTPYGINSHRLLVTGHRVPYEKVADPKVSIRNGFDWTVQPWMWMRVAITAAGLLVWILLALKWVLDDRRRRRSQRLARAAGPRGPDA